MVTCPQRLANRIFAYFLGKKNKRLGSQKCKRVCKKSENYT